MSDSSSVSGYSTGESSLSSVSSRNYGGKSKFERDVEAAIRKGVSDCKNLCHWRVHRFPDPSGSGRSFSDAVVKTHRDILKLMAPGRAKCSCEIAACRWAWDRSSGWNHTGMWQTEYVPNGLLQKGIGEVSRDFGAKRVFSLGYTLQPKQFEALTKRFPDWMFVSSRGGGHDHPVAHTTCSIVTDRLYDRLPRGTVESPKVYIDLHGNPTAVERYCARNPEIVVFCFVELITPKDYVRKATKWGPDYRADGTARWVEMAVRDIPRDCGADFGSIVDGIVSIHTAYYYDPQEIVALLTWAPNATFYALMHKFEGYTGELNAGEQRWVKAQRSSQTIITQTNVVSGECYQHVDNSWWFEHDSYAVNDDAMGWTINMLADENFLIIATSVPKTQAMMSTMCVQMAEFFPPDAHCTGRAQTQEQIAASKTVVLSLYGAVTTMPIAPHLVGYFGDLRTTAVGRARTAKQYQDHISRARVKANSLMTDKKVRVDAQQLADIARFSFFLDFEDQYGADGHMFSENYARTLSADPLYRHGAGAITRGTLSMLTDMLMAAASAKDLKTGILKAAGHGVQHLNRGKLLDTL